MFEKRPVTCTLVTMILGGGLLVLPAGDAHTAPQIGLRSRVMQPQITTQPRIGTQPRITTHSQIRTPERTTPSRGGFNWEGAVRGLIEQSARPRPYPVPRPDTQRYYPQPRYVQPVEQPRVTPPENVVVVRVPTQPSPVEGCVSELSTRMAHCYAKELAAMCQQSFDAVLVGLRNDGADVKVLEQLLAKIQVKISAKESWREIAPLVRELLDGEPLAAHVAVKEECQRIVHLLAVRDAFLIVAGASPRGLGVPISIPGIPTGMIWILFDPLLPAGSGLLVSGAIMVCGTGGVGEMCVDYTSAAAGLGLPVADADATLVPEVDDDAAPSAEEIIVRNRKDAGGAVSYVVNDRHSFALQPGYKQRLPADKEWKIEFDQGNNQGPTQRRLERGVYEFRVVRNKWDLVKVDFKITIDNKQGVQGFACLVNDEVVEIEPGESKTYAGSEPVDIKFDGGQGPDKPKHKNLNKSGTYKVAVDTQSNYLDLFAQSEPQE